MPMDTPIKNKKRIVVPWDARYAYSVTILAYVVSQLFTTLPLLVALFFTNWSTIEDSLLDQPWMSLSLTGVGAVGIFVVLYYFLHKKKYGFSQLKLQKGSPLKSLLLVAGTYIVYILLSVAVAAIVQALFPSFNADQEQLVGYKNAVGWQLILAFVGLVVVPPIAEEMLFRGFLYQGLRDNWNKHATLWWGFGVAIAVALLAGAIAGIIVALLIVVSIVIGKKHPARAAAIVTSVLFGLVHMQWNISIDTFIFSFALIYVFEKTQNLWAAIVLHALKNGIAFVGLFILS